MLTNSSSHGNGAPGSTWILDSGASFHVIGDSRNIKQFTHFDGTEQIFIGNGEGLSISNTGSSTFVSPNDTGTTFKLHKLLHVPSISKNLLSVSQFAKDNSVYSPLELIFTDLCGPSHVTSYAGYTYYVSFIDAFSRYTWIFPIKSKAETISVFQNFKSMVELQLNTKIKSIQSDWGGDLSLVF